MIYPCTRNEPYAFVVYAVLVIVLTHHKRVKRHLLDDKSFCSPLHLTRDGTRVQIKSSRVDDIFFLTLPMFAYGRVKPTWIRKSVVKKQVFKPQTRDLHRFFFFIFERQFINQIVRSIDIEILNKNIYIYVQHLICGSLRIAKGV